MGRTNTGITLDDDVFDRLEAIRDAMETLDPYDRKPARTAIIEPLVAEWVEEHEHLIEEAREAEDAGNRPIPVVAN